MQGFLTSLASVAGILGPWLATNLFGFFISPHTPVHLTGAAFFASAGLTALAMALAIRAFRRTQIEAPPAGIPVEST